MTNLPEPNFIERDPDTIMKAWTELYEAKSGKVLQPAQIEKLMIDVGAYRETILRMDIQETAKKNLLSYAPLDVLRHIGEPLGVEQLLADCAVTTIKFSIDEVLDFNLTIPKGIFQTTEDVILLAGMTEITVAAVCQTSGAGANNYVLGAINNLITPLSYISRVENITVSGGGADDEEADNLRERIRQAPEKFSNAGSVGAYEYHTLSAHQSITDVAVISPSPGVVNIYPLTNEGNPTEEVINIVQNYLSDDMIRPLTDYVQVISPENIQFNIDATIWLYKDADVTSVNTTIVARMKEYKLTLSEKLGKDVVQTQIIAILNSIYGVYKVRLNAPQDIIVQTHQWAELKNYNISIGGFADE